MKWKRPNSVPVPTVWARFHGKSERGGIKRQYWIQDLTSDYHKDVIQLMATKFVTKSPICIYTNFIDDQESVNDYIEEWKKMFELGLSLVCLTNDENNDTKLVGCNILGRRCRGGIRNTEEIFKGKASRIAGKALYHVYQNCIDVFAELKIDEYISAFGLYVLPEYRGNGIGYQLLKARGDICIAVGLEVSVTAFTTFAGQKLAEKLGFQDLYKISYKDLENINPMFKFPGIENDKTKTIRLMYKRYK